ncbi:hypothetical protein BGW41_002222 [Actinomortierella wolfii]|nr:hypothetical protein BGW41_002222 [Actinomortierella wolfii]
MSTTNSLQAHRTVGIQATSTTTIAPSSSSPSSSSATITPTSPVQLPQLLSGPWANPVSCLQADWILLYALKTILVIFQKDAAGTLKALMKPRESESTTTTTTTVGYFTSVQLQKRLWHRAMFFLVEFDRAFTSSRQDMPRLFESVTEEMCRQRWKMLRIDYREFKRRHGVQMSDIRPLSQQERDIALVKAFMLEKESRSTSTTITTMTTTITAAATDTKKRMEEMPTAAMVVDDVSATTETNDDAADDDFVFNTEKDIDFWVKEVCDMEQWKALEKDASPQPVASAWRLPVGASKSSATTTTTTTETESTTKTTALVQVVANSPAPPSPLTSAPRPSLASPASKSDITPSLMDAKARVQITASTAAGDHGGTTASATTLSTTSPVPSTGSKATPSPSLPPRLTPEIIPTPLFPPSTKSSRYGFQRSTSWGPQSRSQTITQFFEAMQRPKASASGFKHHKSETAIQNRHLHTQERNHEQHQPQLPKKQTDQEHGSMVVDDASDRHNMEDGNLTSVTSPTTGRRPSRTAKEVGQQRLRDMLANWESKVAQTLEDERRQERDLEHEKNPTTLNRHTRTPSTALEMAPLSPRKRKRTISNNQDSSTDANSTHSNIINNGHISAREDMTKDSSPRAVSELGPVKQKVPQPSTQPTLREVMAKRGWVVQPISIARSPTPTSESTNFVNSTATTSETPCTAMEQSGYLQHGHPREKERFSPDEGGGGTTDMDIVNNEICVPSLRINEYIATNDTHDAPISGASPYNTLSPHATPPAETVAQTSAGVSRHSSPTPILASLSTHPLSSLPPTSLFSRAPSVSSTEITPLNLKDSRHESLNELLLELEHKRRQDRTFYEKALEQQQEQLQALNTVVETQQAEIASLKSSIAILTNAVYVLQEEEKAARRRGCVCSIHNQQLQQRQREQHSPESEPP